jgi:tryptophan 2,3-dioxygenase
VFVNAQGVNWRDTDDHDFWNCGDVVERLADLEAALEAAPSRHSLYVEQQRAFATSSLGDTSGVAPEACARIILATLR